MLSHPDTTIILALGYVPWLLTMWLGKPRPTLRIWVVLAIGMPLIALAAVLPWLLNVRDLLGSNIQSPFTSSPNYWQVMILYHGILIVPVALVGAIIGLRKRDQIAILSVGWLVLILEFSTLGILERLFPPLADWILRYDYPFSIAWHGPIIPYAILGGTGFLWLWQHWLEARFGAFWERRGKVILVGLAVLALIGLLLNSQILAFSKGRVGFFGAFASADDVTAMEWLRKNTPPMPAYLIIPVHSRTIRMRAIGFRLSPSVIVFITDGSPFSVIHSPAWTNRNACAPSGEIRQTRRMLALLQSSGIDYVIVPQIVTNPASIETMFRWRPQSEDRVEMDSALTDAPFLHLVFDSHGAQVYEFVAN